ncbi:MAG: hypothetical protein ACK5TN_22080 [Acidobacteriota bacterium]
MAELICIDSDDRDAELAGLNFRTVFEPAPLGCDLFRMGAQLSERFSPLRRSLTKATDAVQQEIILFVLHAPGTPQ